MRAQLQTAVVDEIGPREEVLLIRAAAPAEEDAALAMVRRCSSKTLFHRFHGYVDAAGHFSRHWDGSTEAIFLAWQGHTCVAISELAADAHLGLLVEDRWQRRGVGTRLLRAVVDEARVRSFEVLHADVLTEDAFLMGALRRIGPLTVSYDADGLSVDVKIESAQV